MEITSTMIVKPEFTIEQAELCKAALLNARFQGTLAEMVQIVEKVHGTIKAIEGAIVEAQAQAVVPSSPPAP